MFPTIVGVRRSPSQRWEGLLLFLFALIPSCSPSRRPRAAGDLNHTNLDDPGPADMQLPINQVVTIVTTVTGVLSGAAHFGNRLRSQFRREKMQFPRDPTGRRRINHTNPDVDESKRTSRSSWT